MIYVSFIVSGALAALVTSLHIQIRTLRREMDTVSWNLGQQRDKNNDFAKGLFDLEWDMKTAGRRLESLRRWGFGSFSWTDAPRPNSLLQGEQSEPSRFQMTKNGPKEVDPRGNSR